MKTFFDLIQEVQKKNRCHHCDGCVTFCSAINYGALGIDENGRPYYSDIDKCIECGLCYMICPETNELDEEIKKRAERSAPSGRIIGTTIARARDLIVRKKGTDGGVVTAILLHLFEKGKINGAIVSKNTGSGRVPWLAKTEEEILDAAGSHFDYSHGMAGFGSAYSTFSPSVSALSEIRKEGLSRIAFVGTPCQINSIRKMQALGIVPADSIDLCLGLFCSGNFVMTEENFNTLEDKYHIQYKDIEKINIKENFIITQTTGEKKELPLSALENIKRTACRYSDDFSAEYADISFGGLGADDGWTTVVIRSPVGRAVFADALENELENYRYQDNTRYATNAEDRVIHASREKKACAVKNLQDINSSGTRVIG
ncbi:MAG: Coenzyme F420 hydrogenase/dehydrogenase, beta subunit C-terminal domain [Thermodesulfobacteriota bacterium]|nr:Coenzyme F420 hydrogenase/dehydrogenase, beta subunit C-terminal domain [Thermodesulfobacteriota bacterium]